MRWCGFVGRWRDQTRSCIRRAQLGVGMRSQADPSGSVWRRWDPHIHTPGTAMNDQFGADAWDEYLSRIEQSEPKIELLGLPTTAA